MDTQPEIVKLAPSLDCSYCLSRNRGQRAATHTVDGTSVCENHLSEAIEYYRVVRARTRVTIEYYRSERARALEAHR